MRKEIFILLLMSSFVFYSCKKEKENFRPEAAPEVATQSTSNQTIVKSVINWLENQKATSRARSAQKIKLLIDNLELSRIKTESFGQSDQLIIIPIKDDYNRANNIELRNVLHLVTSVATNGEIKGARLVEFIPEESGGLNVIAIAFTKIIMAAFPGVNGQFKLLTLDGKLVNQMTFKHNRLFSYGVVKKRSDGNNSGRMDPPEGCTDWYLYETWYDEEGNLIDYLITYLYTECEDTDGGGGGGWYAAECNMTTEEGEAALAAITSTIITNGSSESGPATGPDGNGIIERPVVVKRHRIKYTFPGGRTGTYALFFPGKLFKTTTNPQWKWKELTFSHIGLYEGDPGPCYFVEFTPALSLTIDEDKLNARFVAEITAILKALCGANMLLKIKHESLNGIYPASDF